MSDEEANLKPFCCPNCAFPFGVGNSRVLIKGGAIHTRSVSWMCYACRCPVRWCAVAPKAQDVGTGLAKTNDDVVKNLSE